jgi:ankyrin repeat protein
MLASYHCNTTCVTFLLAAGADMGKKTVDGKTARELACRTPEPSRKALMEVFDQKPLKR